jgi:hypothetical protein
MTKTKSIFELIELIHIGKPEYPEFDVRYTSVGYFSSLEKTEQQLHEEARKSEVFWKHKYFGFLIGEYPLDDRHFDSCISRRSYLPDGSLLDESLLSTIEDDDGCLEEFTGRPENKIRFKIGDLVEVLFNETVTLEIVGNTPPSPDKVQRMRSHNVHLDLTDDCYYILNQYGGHSHPESVDLFPVRFKVREQLRKKLSGSDEYYSYRAFYDN